MSCQCPNLLENAMSNLFDQSRAQFRAEYDENCKLIYLGHANSGISENESGWTIQKFTYNEQGCLTGNQFPGESKNAGNSYPNHKWSDRANYKYV